MPRPTLVLVTGPPASGKTTLAYAISQGLPCPLISRDEIKRGLVHADGGGKPVWGGSISRRTAETFFGVLRLLLSSGVTVVAEAALQDEQWWRPDLESIGEIADIRIVHCTADPSAVRGRLAQRVTARDPLRAAHPDDELLEALDSGNLTLESFEPISKFAPSLRVDGTDGYQPSLDAILAFINRR